VAVLLYDVESCPLLVRDNKNSHLGYSLVNEVV